MTGRVAMEAIRGRVDVVVRVESQSRKSRMGRLVLGIGEMGWEVCD